MAFDSIPARLLRQALDRPDAPAYYVRRDGQWVPTPWRDYVAEVRQAARALLALGAGKGTTTCILGFNRPEWCILDFATMAVGGAPAGIYTTSSPSEIEYIVNHSEAPVLLVETEAQWRRVEEVIDHLPKLQRVVMMRGAPPIAHPKVLTWEGFLALGATVDGHRVDEAVDALEPDGLATLIYTSGTTGPPKAVMLSHNNLSWTADVVRSLAEVSASDSVLSYLPLSHIAEQMFTLHVPATYGVSAYFAESFDKVGDNLREVQPTIIFGVPRVWEKIQLGVAAKLADAPPLKKKLAGWAFSVARRAADYSCRGESPPLRLALEYAVAQRLIFQKLKPAIGVGRAKLCVSGAAPISRETLDYLAGLDVIVHEVYGQSEGCGPTSFNRPGRTRLGTVGPPLPGVEVRIADDGEILVRGPNVFLGYAKDPQATSETLENGWLHSGDLGAYDADGFLSITGRKKEIIVTSGGKNITPKNIEHALKSSPLIAEAVVIGDRRNYLTALVWVDPEKARAVARDPSRPFEDEGVRAEVQKVVDRVNRDLARVEQVRKFALPERALSIEGGELTPTLKIKRNVVAQRFAEEIEAMYAEPSASRTA